MCTLRAHSRCHRPSATVAACPCAARPERAHALPLRPLLPPPTRTRRSSGPLDGAAAMAATVSTAPATVDDVDVDAAAAGVHVAHWYTSHCRSSPSRRANTVRQQLLPRLAAAAWAAADDAAASIAGAAATAAAMWATCPHSVPHTKRSPRSCWADRDCSALAGLLATCHVPGWARSGAATWVSSADRRSALAACDLWA